MNRSEIEDQYKWNLAHIYENEQQWEEEYQKVEAYIKEIAAFSGCLSTSADHLLQCFTIFENSSLLMERLYVYASLHKDEDTRESNYQTLSERAHTLNVKLNMATSFMEPELLALEPNILHQFYLDKPELTHFKLTIDRILRSKPHVLTKEIEQLLAKVGDISSIPGNVFTMFNNADIKFPSIQNEHGEQVQLTKGNYIQIMESKNRDVRKAAFKALNESYISYKNTLAATLYGNIKKNIFYADIKKFPSALHMELFPDNVPVEVYENLIQTVKNNLDPIYQYMELRKQALDLDTVHMYDVYTPLIPELDVEITYDQAYDTMIEGLSVLGGEYINLLKEARQNRWIDVFENEGKRSGAYSWGAYGSHPYVLLNHNKNINSMFTLAHEMGHALHSYYSDQENPYLYSQYTIFVAEVASTVNEVLLMNHLLRTTNDKKMRMYLINYFLEQFRTTVYRQTMFAEFEKIAHELVQNGTPLTPDKFAEIYFDLNKTYYGDQVVSDEEIAYEWARIPHFYRSFYVYKYATGFCATISIAKRILEEGQPAVDDYLKFLKSGCTDDPIELLKIAGVDMASPEPIQNALSYFAELVNELQSLYNE